MVQTWAPAVMVESLRTSTSSSSAIMAVSCSQNSGYSFAMSWMGQWPWHSWAERRVTPLGPRGVTVVWDAALLRGTAADWLPDTVAGRCELVEHQVVVKAKWGLSVTERERAAMRRVLASCPAG